MRGGHPRASRVVSVGRALVVGVLALAVFSVVPILPAHAQSVTPFTMTITSSTTNSQELRGYYTVIYDASGSVVGTGFTPAQYSVVEGQTYSVLADSYGDCQFYAWGGPDHPAYFDNPHTFTASPSLGLDAIYSCGAPSGTSPLTIETLDTSGNAISGYYTVLNQSGSIVSTSFTPASFHLYDGQNYSVQVDGYGSCHFDHWLDTGSTTFYRTVSIDAATTYTAVMNCGTTGTSGSASLTVNSVDQNGNLLYGYYVDLDTGGGPPGSPILVLQTGFTTAVFDGLTAGTPYGIYPQSYGSCTFYGFQGYAPGNLGTSFQAGDNFLTAIYHCA
jgi:hypothetical protein